VLLLDDLEKGLAGDAATWTKETIKAILDQVDNVGHPIVITTSNASPEQHKRALAKKEWLYSRLMKLFHWVEVDGINWRLKEAQESGILIDIEE
jgi:DNA replication protein DnaC